MNKILQLINCPNKALLLRAICRSIFPNKNSKANLEKSLRATYKWLCEAQDATSDAGVSAAYHVIRGWHASYPETTGYIIPTFLTYSVVMGDEKAKERAVKMADWEIDIQMQSGAVQSGSIDLPPSPAVFNTAQVLEGWTSIYGVTEEAHFADAAKRSAQWLVDVMDDDGAWRKDLSIMSNAVPQTYNVLSASRLARAGQVFNEPSWVDAARRNADWTITQQESNGWFQNCAMQKNTLPVLHPIAYTLEGLLNLGLLLREEKYIHAVVKVVQTLVSKLSSGKKLSGVYDSDWNEAVSWRCLTGEAQFAIVLYRLAMYCGHNGTEKTIANEILEELARSQDTDSPYSENGGGITGSIPIWGGYGRFEYLNWAAKYYLDALLLAVKEIDPHPLPSWYDFPNTD
jgi:uncharacterized protein YyaL (SSP411 family)